MGKEKAKKENQIFTEATKSVQEMNKVCEHISRRRSSNCKKDYQRDKGTLGFINIEF
jgi:hypothetical protein